MKTAIWFRRFASLALCGALLLPGALAAPEDWEDDPEDSHWEEDPEDGEPSAGDDGGEPAAGEPTLSSGIVDPQIQATAALLVNPDTGMVLYEKDADAQRFPASTTKIMTALVVLENVSDLEETVTAEASDFENVTADSSNADIKLGEQVRIIDLLYCLMLPSANEAAYMLARHVGGTSEHFVDMMNQKAAELGCTGTHFSNPCGLHEEDHYTTARDLLLMAEAAMEDPTFSNIADTVQKSLPATNIHEERKIYTTNQLIFSSYQPWYYAYCKGIKTGHTSQAGNCLVSYAVRGKARLYAVVLGCEDAPDNTTVAKSFTETKRLFEWGYENYVSTMLAKQGDAVAEIDIHLSTDTNKLVLTARTDLSASIPKTLTLDDLEKTDTLPESRDAPVKAGEVIGSVTYSYGGVAYGTVELVALNDVERSNVLYYADKLEHFFKGAVFRIVFVVVAVFIVLYILFNLVFGGMRRRNQRKKMRSRYGSSNYQRRRRR